MAERDHDINPALMVIDVQSGFVSKGGSYDLLRAYPKNKTPSEFGSHNRQISIIPIQDRASIDDLPYDIPIEVFLG